MSWLINKQSVYNLIYLFLIMSLIFNLFNPFNCLIYINIYIKNYNRN